MTALALTLTGITALSPAVFGQAGNGAAGTGNNTAGAAGNNAAGVGGNTGAAGLGGGTGAGGAAGSTGVGSPGAAPGAGTNPANGNGVPGTAGQSNGNSDLISAPPASGNAGLGNTAQGQNGANGNAAPGTNTNTSPGNSAPGVTPPTTTWNLSSAIDAALKSSTDYANAQRTVEIDKKRADEQAAAGRPNVNASGSATRYDQATKIAIGGSAPITVQLDHSEDLAINLSNKIDLTGQIRTASSQEKLQAQADEYQAAQIRNDRILRAQTIYYNLLRARHQVQVAQASLQDAQTQQTTAVNLNENGVGQKIDVLRANTQVATAQQNLTQALNEEGVAAANFNDLVGQPLKTPVYLQDVAGASVGETAVGNASVGAPTANETLFPAPTPETDAIDLDKSLQTAYAQRPEILQAATLVQADKLGIKLAHAGLEPSLQLSARGDYYPTTSFQTPRQRVAEVTASLVFPLYDGGATRDRVAEAKLRTQNAQASYGSSQTDVALDVRQSYLDLVTAANQITAANTALQQAVAARQLAQIRYEGQVGLYLEVTDAEAALVTAQNNQVNAVYNYLVAKAQFLNAIGTPQTQ